MENRNLTQNSKGWTDLSLAAKKRGLETLSVPMTLFSIVCVILLIVHVFEKNIFNEEGRIDYIVILLLILAVSPWLSGILSKITLPGGYAVEFLHREIKETQKEVSDAREDIARIFALSMSAETYEKLYSLYHHYPEEWEVYIPENPTEGMSAELNYLKLLGYIKFDGTPGIHGVVDLPKGQQTNSVLCRAIKVTESGLEFIRLHERYAESTERKSSSDVR